MKNKRKFSSGISRRSFIKGAGALSGAALATGSLSMPAFAQQRTLKIGHVSPKTGPLAAFAEADDFILQGVRGLLKNGLKIGSKTYPVEIITKDSQSNPNRAAGVASELILKDEIDIMVVSSTPETTNPVSDQCEIAEVPCMSTMAPWQPWFFGRGGNPAEGFDWTYHYFWGLEDVIAVFTNMWNSLSTNKVVGGVLPNDGDGNAWGDKKLGFPPALTQKGFKFVDPGRYQNLTDDFSNHLATFKKEGVEIVTGVVIPPDMVTFWTQAKQQGFNPKIVSVGKALLYPTAVETLGDTGHNISTEVWWTPNHPYSSSLTGESSAALAKGFTAATGKQWTQTIGFTHSLFEMALDVLKRADDLDEPESIRDAITATQLDTIVGPISWKNGKGPFKNVTKTPLVGGQWRLGGQFKYDLKVVNNQTASNIPLQGEMEVLT